MIFAVGLQRGILDGETEGSQVMIGRRRSESLLRVVENGDFGGVFGVERVESAAVEFVPTVEQKSGLGAQYFSLSYRYTSNKC